MPGEVNHHAVVFLGDGGQPCLKLPFDIGHGSLLASQPVYIFRAEIAAFRTNQYGIDGICIALRKFELGFGRQVLVSADADDQRITPRHGYGRRRSRVIFLVLQITGFGWTWPPHRLSRHNHNQPK